MFGSASRCDQRGYAAQDSDEREPFEPDLASPRGEDVTEIDGHGCARTISSYIFWLR